MNLQMRQSPLELLAVTSSGFEARRSIVPRRDELETVVAWQDERGELFYKVNRAETSEFVAGPLGLEEMEANTTLEKDRVWRLKLITTRFLWDIMDTESWGIQELFVQCCARSKLQARLRDEHDLFIDFDAFTDFLEISRLQIKRSSSSQQELYAVFRSIRELSLDSADDDRVSFGAFRTWLIDPFHTAFWTDYVRRILNCGESTEALRSKLYHEFGLAADLNHPLSRKSVLWNNFLVSIDQFHASLGVEVASAQDKSRLLYRFDPYGQGQVLVSAFVDHLIDTLHQLQDTSESFRTRAQFDRSKPRKTAVLNSRLRPNVETFTSVNAVRGLFAARALAASRESEYSASCERSSSAFSESRAQNRLKNQQSKYQEQLELVAEGNKHLASIRSIPVTRLLRCVGKQLEKWKAPSFEGQRFDRVFVDISSHTHSSRHNKYLSLEASYAND